MEIASNASIGLIDRADSTGSHQLQLWIESSGHGYRYLIRSAYMPGGRLVRSCVLDSGPCDRNYKTVRGAGESAFALLSAPQCPNPNPNPSESLNSNSGA